MSLPLSSSQDQPREQLADAVRVGHNRHQTWYQNLVRPGDAPLSQEDHKHVFPSPQRLQLQLMFQREYQQRQEQQKNCRQEWWQRKSGADPNFQSPAPSPAGTGVSGLYAEPQQQHTPHPSMRARGPQLAARSFSQPSAEDAQRLRSESRARMEQDLVMKERGNMIKAAHLIKHDTEKRIRQIKRELTTTVQLLREQELADRLRMPDQTSARSVSAPLSDSPYSHTQANLLRAYHMMPAQQPSATYHSNYRDQMATYNTMLQEYQQGNVYQSYQTAKRLIQMLMQKEFTPSQARLRPDMFTAQQQAALYKGPVGNSSMQSVFRTPVPQAAMSRRDPRLNRSSHQYQTPLHDVTPRLNQSSCQYSEQDITPEIIYHSDITSKPGIVRRNSTPRKQSEDEHPTLDENAHVRKSETKRHHRKSVKSPEKAGLEKDSKAGFTVKEDNQTANTAETNSPAVSEAREDKQSGEGSHTASKVQPLDWEQLQQRSQRHHRARRSRRSSEDAKPGGQRKESKDTDRRSNTASKSKETSTHGEQQCEDAEEQMIDALTDRQITRSSTNLKMKNSNQEEKPQPESNNTTSKPRVTILQKKNKKTEAEQVENKSETVEKQVPIGNQRLNRQDHLKNDHRKILADSVSEPRPQACNAKNKQFFNSTDVKSKDTVPSQSRSHSSVQKRSSKTDLAENGEMNENKVQGQKSGVHNTAQSKAILNSPEPPVTQTDVPDRPDGPTVPDHGSSVDPRPIQRPPEASQTVQHSLSELKQLSEEHRELKTRHQSRPSVQPARSRCPPSPQIQQRPPAGRGQSSHSSHAPVPEHQRPSRSQPAPGITRPAAHILHQPSSNSQQSHAPRSGRPPPDTRHQTGTRHATPAAKPQDSTTPHTNPSNNMKSREAKSPGNDVKQGGRKSPGNSYVIRNSGQRHASRAPSGAQGENAGSSRSPGNRSTRSSSAGSKPSPESGRKTQVSPPSVKPRRHRYRRKPWNKDVSYDKSGANIEQGQQRSQDTARDHSWRGAASRNWRQRETWDLPPRRRPYQWDDMKVAPPKKWRVVSQEGGMLTVKVNQASMQQVSEGQQKNTGRSSKQGASQKMENATERSGDKTQTKDQEQVSEASSLKTGESASLERDEEPQLPENSNQKSDVCKANVAEKLVSKDETLHSSTSFERMEANASQTEQTDDMKQQKDHAGEKTSQSRKPAKIDVCIPEHCMNRSIDMNKTNTTSYEKESKPSEKYDGQRSEQMHESQSFKTNCTNPENMSKKESQDHTTKPSNDVEKLQDNKKSGACISKPDEQTQNTKSASDSEMHASDEQLPELKEGKPGTLETQAESETAEGTGVLDQPRQATEQKPQTLLEHVLAVLDKKVILEEEEGQEEDKNGEEEDTKDATSPSHVTNPDSVLQPRPRAQKNIPQQSNESVPEPDVSRPDQEILEDDSQGIEDAQQSADSSDVDKMSQEDKTYKIDTTDQTDQERSAAEHASLTDDESKKTEEDMPDVFISPPANPVSRDRGEGCTVHSPDLSPSAKLLLLEEMEDWQSLGASHGGKTCDEYLQSLVDTSEPSVDQSQAVGSQFEYAMTRTEVKPHSVGHNRQPEDNVLPSPCDTDSVPVLDKPQPDESSLHPVGTTLDDSFPSAGEPTLGKSLRSEGEPTHGKSLPSENEPTHGKSLPSEGEPTLGKSLPSEGEPTHGKSLPSEGEPTLGKSPLSEGEPILGKSLPSEGELTLGKSLPSEDEPTLGKPLPNEGESTLVNSLPGEGESNGFPLPEDSKLGESLPCECKPNGPLPPLGEPRPDNDLLLRIHGPNVVDFPTSANNPLSEGEQSEDVGMLPAFGKPHLQDTSTYINNNLEHADQPPVEVLQIPISQSACDLIETQPGGPIVEREVLENASQLERYEETELEQETGRSSGLSFPDSVTTVEDSQGKQSSNPPCTISDHDSISQDHTSTTADKTKAWDKDGRAKPDSSKPENGVETPVLPGPIINIRGVESVEKDDAELFAGMNGSHTEVSMTSIKKTGTVAVHMYGELQFVTVDIDSCKETTVTEGIVSLGNVEPPVTKSNSSGEILDSRKYASAFGDCMIATPNDPTDMRQTNVNRTEVSKTNKNIIDQSGWNGDFSAVASLAEESGSCIDEAVEPRNPESLPTLSSLKEPNLQDGSEIDGDVPSVSSNSADICGAVAELVNNSTCESSDNDGTCQNVYKADYTSMITSRLQSIAKPRPNSSSKKKSVKFADILVIGEDGTSSPINTRPRDTSHQNNDSPKSSNLKMRSPPADVRFSLWDALEEDTDTQKVSELCLVCGGFKSREAMNATRGIALVDRLTFMGYF